MADFTRPPYRGNANCPQVSDKALQESQEPRVFYVLQRASPQKLATVCTDCKLRKPEQVPTKELNIAKPLVKPLGILILMFVWNQILRALVDTSSHNIFRECLML